MPAVVMIAMIRSQLWSPYHVPTSTDERVGSGLAVASAMAGIWLGLAAAGAPVLGVNVAGVVEVHPERNAATNTAARDVLLPISVNPASSRRRHRYVVGRRSRGGRGTRGNPRR